MEVQRIKSVIKEVFGLDAELKSKFTLKFGKIINNTWIVCEVRYFLEVTVADQVENAMVDLKQIFRITWPNEKISENTFCLTLPSTKSGAKWG